MNAIKLLGAIALFAGAVSANAAYDFNSGKPYVGAKIGQAGFTTPANYQVNLINYGVYGGYNFNHNAGVELEFQKTNAKDFYNIPSAIDGTISNVNFSTQNYGVYGTYRYGINATPFYIKGRVGVAKNEVSAGVVGRNTGNQASNANTGGNQASNTNTGNNATNQLNNLNNARVVFDKVGLAGGVGVGYKATPNVAIELGYNRLPNYEQETGEKTTDGKQIQGYLKNNSAWTIGAQVSF